MFLLSTATPTPPKPKNTQKKNMQTYANNIKEHKTNATETMEEQSQHDPSKPLCCFYPHQGFRIRPNAPPPRRPKISPSLKATPPPSAPRVALGVHRGVGGQQHFDHICVAISRRLVKGSCLTSEVRPPGASGDRRRRRVGEARGVERFQRSEARRSRYGVRGLRETGKVLWCFPAWKPGCWEEIYEDENRSDFIS